MNKEAMPPQGVAACLLAASGKCSLAGCQPGRSCMPHSVRLAAWDTLGSGIVTLLNKQRGLAHATLGLAALQGAALFFDSNTLCL